MPMLNAHGAQWCHDDVIAVAEIAGDNLDCIMLTKPYDASAAPT